MQHCLPFELNDSIQIKGSRFSPLPGIMISQVEREHCGRASITVVFGSRGGCGATDFDILGAF